MRGKPFTFAQFGGGLNLAESVYQLSDSESRDCLNVVATPRGAIRKRNGSTVLAKPAVALDSLFPLTAVGPRLIGQGGAALYAIDAAGAITTITGTSGATAGKRWEFAQAVAQGGEGPLYGMDGSVAAQWTGAGVMAPMTANLGNLPIGKYLLYHGNRLWVAGMAAYTPSGGAALADPGSAVVFSNPGAPRDYPATNVVQFDPGDGEAISGIGSFGPYVLVFKPNKVWVIYDLDTGANRRLSVNAGCIAHRSIAETREGTFFLTKDQGVMICDGSSLKRVSDKVVPLLEKISPAQRANAAGTFHDRHYYLSYCASGAVNNRTLDLQTDIGAWWLHDYAAQQWAVWDQSGVHKVYAAKPLAVGGVFTVEEAFVDGELQDSRGYAAADSGVAIPAHWKSAFHTFGAPYLRKRLRRLHFDGWGTIEVLLGTDFSNYDVLKGRINTIEDSDLWAGASDTGWAVENGTYWGGQILIGEGEILTPGVARAWSVIFRNNDPSTFEVESYTMAITPRKD